MKASSTLLAGLLILAAGVVLIICNETITGKGIVTAVGVLFLLAGIINVVLYSGSGTRQSVTEPSGDKASRKDTSARHSGGGVSPIARVFGIIVSVAAVILGVSMFLFTDAFAKLIPLLFGLLLLTGTLIQVYIVGVGTRPLVMPTWTYAIPGVMLILSIVLFAVTMSEPRMMTVTGAGFVVFGVGGFIEALILNSERRKMMREQRAHDKKVVVDVKATDVKELKSLDDK